ncbi:deoxyribodipyrimidine photo-lyase [Pigmentiphaga litoralis]|uniref:cryptochrome/photolyase family protein n=1 Tax=Pigmentiphaga litoralis TaxID=516702 RepID=UPI0016796887|nr:deoxyribodipyrimidine photo-lyase [Pigmentiphaga litoralis]GGX05149.1 deoxyribodipyrimidine photo-lyase [Pigmentiphaga litoralis]
MASSPPLALFWFRRDLRLADNVGLFQALSQNDAVVPVFIFDKDILDELPRHDRRVAFLHGAIAELKAALQAAGSDLVVRHARGREAIPALVQEFGASAVFTNEDYEPDAHERDAAVIEALDAMGIPLRLFKDTVIFGSSEILTKQGRPYTVFTPYKNAWRKALKPEHYAEAPSKDHLQSLKKVDGGKMPTLEALGFEALSSKDPHPEPTPEGAAKRLDRFVAKVIDGYKQSRDLPAVPGTSYLSVYNRFGLLSVRHLVRASLQAIEGSKGAAREGAETWLSELVWRDFYFQFLYHHPTAVDGPYREEYTALQWENDEGLFQAWCDGQTGYPLVDAAMHQINSTGYMHNRLRMVTASFLTKDLLVDYRKGEAYFALALIDYDQAANNGGWQWAASTGCDPQPYFRIFSPSRQSERYDPDGEFIKRFLPVFKDVPGKYLHAPWEHTAKLAEFGIELGKHYPKPVVDHDERRLKALNLFKAARASKGVPDKESSA